MRFISNMLAFTLFIISVAAWERCKCTPLESCWPSPSTWSALNSSVSGHLIANTPPAVSCYPPSLSLATCAEVLIGLSNSTYIRDNPVALAAPINETCPAVNYAAGETPGTCTLGSLPVYTVDAYSVDDVVKGINFARKHNLRVVIRNTGHDSSGRSTGYGSLEIWIRHLRLGISIQETYAASDNCKKANWTGGAMTIAGGYIWGEAFAVAKAHNVIVVSGGDPTVGCIGGWAQGGGHGPASRDYGLGADQILEAQVVLASGRVVTASACQNPELYTAIRGGGGGTYGIVVSTTIKAHPQSPVVAQDLSFYPRSNADISAFFQALTTLYASFPEISEAGYSGYGNWAYSSFGPVVPGSGATTGYQHTLAIFNRSLPSARTIFAPTAAKLAFFNASLVFNITYLSFPTYHAYYDYTARAGPAPVGQSGAYGSRLLDRRSLSSVQNLSKMLNITAGAPGEFTFNNVCLVSGGQVWDDASDPYSGLNPAWRRSYVHNIVARAFLPGMGEGERDLVRKDITERKIRALREIAPRTGSYMNEADRLDPLFLEDFYGGSLSKLEAAKKKYDKEGLFYCPTCVGSEKWEEDAAGKLCQKINWPL
ncbi:hypothetical protein B0O99DRAFT_636793 [Bisporella sp. PMI_857]|nr:hypothetical protein B0O99DRAFT_636793 [Bisporella sp. PMI_857]